MQPWRRGPRARSFRGHAIPPPNPGPMAADDLRARADARFDEALRETGARDPRDYYRQRLRALKEADGNAFRRALAYYEDTLIPAVADPATDAIAAWLEYGRVLAALAEPGGRTVVLDESGLSSEYAPPVPPNALVLHLPKTPTRPALIVGIPPTLSPAQRAAHDLLVKQSLGR